MILLIWELQDSPVKLYSFVVGNEEDLADDEFVGDLESDPLSLKELLQ